MASSPIAPQDAVTLREAVAKQFAYRPTLRHVLSEMCFKVFAKHYPAQAKAVIDHNDLEPYTLLRPDPEGSVAPEKLLSLLLDAYVKGYAIAFGVNDELKLKPYSQEYLAYSLKQASGGKYDPGEGGELLALAPLNDGLNEMLTGLIGAFQQAQVSFWNEDDAIPPDTTGVSRHGWMRQALRVALMGNVSRSALGAEERDCLHEVLLGINKGASVTAIELVYQGADRTTEYLLPDLLIEAERDERTLVVRCSPSGLFTVFETLQGFEDHLLEEQLPRMRFDQLRWQRRTLEGDPFLQQSGLLLECLLQDVDRLQLSSITDRETLEQAMSTLSDPSQHFLNDVFFSEAAEFASIPAWLAAGATEDRFDYQVAMLDVAIAQARSGGRTSLDGVDDLQRYAARRLREQMRQDHPGGRDHAPDELTLHLSTPKRETDVQLPVELEDAGSMTLTQFAIDRLTGLQDAVITKLTAGDDDALEPWMTTTYAVELVEQVDVGGEYPGYVEALLKDATQLTQRIERFTLEWRSALFFDGLKAKVDGVLDADCWRALAEFCRSRRDLKSNIDLSPLGFAAQAGTQQQDVAMCMYVIEVKEPKAVLLYRPFYRDHPLLHFADRQALMAALAQSGELQDSVLQWLPDSVYRVYANGGFVEPHLRRVIFDTSVWPLPVKPVSLWLKPFKADIDTWLFDDKCKALQVLADRESTSNAEERWQVIKRFAWLLFDLVAPVLPGPIGAVAWLVGLVAPLLEQDDQPQVEGSATVSAVSLVANLALALLHARLPNTWAPIQGPALAPIRMVDPTPLEPLSLPKADASISRGAADQALTARVGQVALGHGWGPGPVKQRQMLLPYKATVDLTTAVKVDNLDLLEGRYYVTLYGDPYQVQNDDVGRRIVGPAGEKGPLLYHDGQWRIRADGFALGGAPGARRKPDQARYDALTQSLEALETRIATDHQASGLLNKVEEEAYTSLQKYEMGRHNTEQQKDTLPPESYERLMSSFVEKIANQSSLYEKALSDYVESVERLIELNVQRVEKVDEVLALLKRRSASSTAFERYTNDRSRGQDMIILLCRGIFSRLSVMADYPALRELGQALNGHVIEGDMVAKYQDYKRRLGKTVVVQARIVKVSALLDRFIPDVPAGTDLNRNRPGEQALSIEQVKAQRTFTTVDIRFQEALHYGDLGLNFDHKDSAGKMAGYHRALIGNRLLAAAYAHGEVMVGNLTSAEQIEVLQTAWDEYSAALINCIDIRRDGGALVDSSKLERYAQSIQALKDNAGALLVAVFDRENGKATTAASAYSPSDTPRSVARTKDGQIVVGDLLTEDGETILEVADRFSDTIVLRFKRTGQEWVEIDAKGVVDTPPVSDDALQKAALELLAEDGAVQEKAEQYVRNDVSHHHLKRLVDAHVQALQAIEDAFDGQETPVAVSIAERRDAWPERLKLLLTRLYSTTAYPDADALRYLHGQGLLRVVYEGPRQVLADDSAMDEYIVYRLSGPNDKRGKPLWVAHFHFAGQGDDARAFNQGHLKTWGQRWYGAKDAKRLAQGGKRIHRGPLTLADAEGIIPF